MKVSEPSEQTHDDIQVNQNFSLKFRQPTPVTWFQENVRRIFHFSPERKTDREESWRRKRRKPD